VKIRIGRVRSSLRQKRGTTKKVGFIVPLAFILPNFAGFSIFYLFPIFFSLFISLHRWQILLPPKFIGISNYAKLLFEDELFWITLKNTAYYTILSIPLGIIVSISLALLMNQKLKLISFYRSCFLIPYVSSMVAVALLWLYLYNADFGLINHILKLIGIPPQRWLTSERWAMPAIAVMSVWKSMGFGMILYLAALQGIPQIYYEAARVDGATRWSQFWHITLPLLQPTTFFYVVISIIGSFQVFAQVQLMTDGGPGYATTVYNFYLYNNAFIYYKMGYAAAMSYILFGILFTLTIIQKKLFARGWTGY